MKLSAIVGVLVFLVLHPVIIYVGGLFLLAVAAVYLTGIAKGKFKMPARITRERQRTRGKRGRQGTRWSIEFL
jgi:hypothetical protein